MYKSKLSRLLSLLCSFLLLFGSLSLNVSASDSENLIDSDLRTWQNYSSLNNNYDTLSVSYYESLDMYRLSSSGTESGIFSGVLLDDTRLISGNSYTLSFLVPSPEFMSDNGYSTTLDSILWHYSDTVIVVGLGFLQANGEFYYHDTAFIGFNEENIESYLGKTCSLTFTAESYTGTPVVAIWIYNMENQGYGRYYYFKDFTLIDNSQEEEDGFFARLFEWFQEKFDAIGESFSNLGNKLTELKDGFIEKITDLKDSFVNKITELKESFVAKLEELKQSFIDLGNALIEGIKSLFIPDEQYILDWKDSLDVLLQEHLGIIYTSATLVSDFIDIAFDIVFDAPDTYSLTVPEVSFEISGTDVTLWGDIAIDFSFMETKVFKILYGMYTVGLYIVFGVLEVKYALRVYRRMMSN